jgi:hypothetical protein
MFDLFWVSIKFVGCLGYIEVGLLGLFQFILFFYLVAFR